MSSHIRGVLEQPDTPQNVMPATITAINADGTFGVDYGTGPVTAYCLAAGAQPNRGDTVMLQRVDASTWLILGPIRTSNSTTTTLSRSVGVPYNVLAASAGGSTPVSATAAQSYRSSDGWAHAGAYQGAFSPSLGYYTGCYFYGAGAFAALAGRTVQSVSIHLHRAPGAGPGGVGSGGFVTQYLALHAHATQPGGAPRLLTSTIAGPALSDASNTADFALPVSWGQALVDGSAYGVAHYAGSTSAYSRSATTSEDAATGRLTIVTAGGSGGGGTWPTRVIDFKASAPQLADGSLNNLFPDGSVGDSADYAFVEVRNSGASTVSGVKAWLTVDSGGGDLSMAVADGTARSSDYGWVYPSLTSLTYTVPTAASGLALPDLAAGQKCLLAVKRNLASATAKRPEFNRLNIQGTAPIGF